MLEIYYSMQEFGRPFIVGAEVPKERLAALQTAFADTLADPELIREADGSKLEIQGLSGPEVDRLVQTALTADPDLLAKLRHALDY